MATKIGKLLRQPRVWILLLFIIGSLYVIPSFKPAGVEISYLENNSPFAEKMSVGEVIYEMKGVEIENLQNYTDAVNAVEPGEQLKILLEGDKLVDATVSASPEDSSKPYLGFNVRETSSMNIKLGLDLQGGARVIIKPIVIGNTTLNDDTIDAIRTVLTSRLSAYNLQDVGIYKIEDFEGNTYLEVTLAGEGSERLVNMVKSVGKFEVKVNNETALTGDSILPNIGEARQDLNSGMWVVQFTTNSEGASALRSAYLEAANSGTTNACSRDTDCSANFACSRGTTQTGTCLPRIEMYLDNKSTFSAPASPSLYETWLAGSETNTLLAESPTEERAKEVEVVLKAGRLPSQIAAFEVISQDYIDPKLGKDFLRGAAIAALAALVAVGLVVFIRYRRLKVMVPILFTGVSEIIIILGMAVAIGWQIDLPAIAGLIATVGTGVDQQIIITDEILGAETEKIWSLKRRVKKAYKIIIIAVATTIAAMLPLMHPGFTGLHVLKGFAIVTILGALIGILITRPAYAKIAETLLEAEE